MKVLITGAQFNNKGAQSLLFSVMNELRNRYQNVQIYYLPLDLGNKYLDSDYDFNIVYDNRFVDDFQFSIKEHVKAYIKMMLFTIKDKKRYEKHGFHNLYSIINQIDVMVDVSGYQLTSNAALSDNYRYIRYINLAKRQGVPVVLLPQSFGPFDYKDRKINVQIKKTLNRVDMIFARETDGKNQLEEYYGIKNVNVLPDIVLQSSEIKHDNIFRYHKEHILSTLHLNTHNNVGVIPNLQTVVHGNEAQVIQIYSLIIEELIAKDKKVYIFRHSNDLEFCRKIYEIFENNDKVFLIENDFNCFEYSEFVKQFDFLIASRYHAVVHAYKQGIPAVVLGWAIKYLEIAKIMSQEEYVIDLNANNFYCNDNAIKCTKKMLDNYKTESIRIKEKLINVQSNSCFEQCATIFQSVIRPEK